MIDLILNRPRKKNQYRTAYIDTTRKNMKRIINLLLVILIAFVCVIPISADEFNYDTGETYSSEEATERFNTFLERKRSGIMPRYTSYSLAVTRLAQGDSRWSSVVLNGSNTGLTIGDAGCALTVATMVYNYYKNQSKTPADLNSQIVINTNVSWSSLANVMGRTLKFENNNVDINTVYDIVEFNLSEDDPVILKLTKTGATHFVVAYGYYESGSNKTIYIRDPGGYNRSTLQNALDAGWNLSKYTVYN